MKIYEITPNEYDTVPSGYVTDENEAIQLCLDGEYTYRELPKIEVSSEIMNKKRFTLVEIVFRLRNDGWNSDDVRLCYSDKPFEKVNHRHYLKFDWIALQMIVGKGETIESVKQSICEQFEIVRKNIDGLDSYDSKVKILEDFGIVRV